MTLGQNEPGRLFAGLAIAGVQVERMNNAEAAASLATAVRSAELMGRPWYSCMALLQQARFARMTNDASAATVFLDLARLTMPNPSTHVAATLALERARQVARFEPSAASSLIDGLGDTAPAIALRAELALRLGDRRLAHDAVALLPPPVTTRQVVTYNMLLALTASDPESAIATVDATLSVAEPQGYMYSIIEAGPGVPDLLAAFPPTLAHQAYVESLLEVSRAVVPPVRIDVADRLIEPLSPRELIVLRYLASRLTNQEIAAALFVSVNTLKTHVKTIYRKLAVSSRAEAVDVGRRIRLI